MITVKGRISRQYARVFGELPKEFTEGWKGIRSVRKLNGVYFLNTWAQTDLISNYKYRGLKIRIETRLE